jgi:hypothetical protein
VIWKLYSCGNFGKILLKLLYNVAKLSAGVCAPIWLFASISTKILFTFSQSVEIE